MPAASAGWTDCRRQVTPLQSCRPLASTRERFPHRRPATSPINCTHDRTAEETRRLRAAAERWVAGRAGWRFPGLEGLPIAISAGAAGAAAPDCGVSTCRAASAEARFHLHSPKHAPVSHSPARWCIDSEAQSAASKAVSTNLPPTRQASSPSHCALSSSTQRQNTLCTPCPLHPIPTQNLSPQLLHHLRHPRVSQVPRRAQHGRHPRRLRRPLPLHLGPDVHHRALVARARRAADREPVGPVGRARRAPLVDCTEWEGG